MRLAASKMPLNERDWANDGLGPDASADEPQNSSSTDRAAALASSIARGHPAASPGGAAKGSGSRATRLAFTMSVAEQKMQASLRPREVSRGAFAATALHGASEERYFPFLPFPGGRVAAASPGTGAA